MRRFLPLLVLLCAPLVARPVSAADTTEANFPAEYLAVVSAESPAGRLKLGPSPDSFVHVTTIRACIGQSEEEARTWLEHIDARTEVIDGTALALKAWFDMPDPTGAEASFEVLVPPGRRVIGLLDSGSVEVDDVEGFVNLRVGIGAVTTRKTRGSLDVTCDTGDVALRACRGKVEASLGVGSLTCTMAELAPDSPVELATGTGPVLLYLPAVADADLELATGGGGIEIEDLRLEYETREPNLIRARLGAGGIPVTARVGAGNIRVVGR